MRYCLLIILQLLTCVVSAQVKMRDVIKQMPDSLLPYLKQNARLDFIDFIDSGMKAEVSNELGGKSVLQELTDDYASIMMNPASHIQLRLLDIEEPVDDARQIICMVHTYGQDISESTVSFYSVLWRALPTEQYVTLPADMHHVVLSSEAPEMTVESDTWMDIPANEEQEKIDKVSKTIKWNGLIFKIY